jgi:predicted permease
MAFGTLAQSVAVLVGLILLGSVLKRIGLISDAHGPVLAKLATHVVLPALIFTVLAKSRFFLVYVELAAVMIIAQLVGLLLGWALARMARLGPAATGSVILCSGFGSSAMLGYPLIAAVFPGETAAMTEAAAIAELGAAPLGYVLGPLVAIYFGVKARTGAGTDTARTVAHSLATFAKSPIFLAIVAGFGWSVLRLPTDAPVIGAVFSGLGMIADANTFLIAVAVGVALRYDRLSESPGVTAGVAAIKLLALPSVVWFASHALTVTDVELEVALIEAAMPSALVAVVFAKTYGCDSAVAARLVVVTAVLSCATTVGVVALFG